ncbi:MAG: tail fiber domain-containing protein [Bacteroidales bacterium]|nr:tail fiber domain-containing protein [Bacteroidales bacterium]
MKTKLTAAVFTLFIYSLSFAQIKITTSQNVGVGVDAPVCKFAIGDVGNTYTKAYIYNSNTGASQRGLQVYQAKTTIGASWSYGIIASVEQGSCSGFLAGISSSAYRGSTAYSNVRTYGLLAQAGNGHNGFNYALYAQLLGSRNGAAVYATIPSKAGDIDVNGMWAGYFRGNVNIEGAIYLNSVYYASDTSLKKDIKPLETDNLSKLIAFNPIKYKLKKPI